MGVPVQFYAIDRELRPVLPDLAEGDVVLLVDYFGVCRQTPDLARKLGPIGILDNTHALFAPTDSTYWSFTSARKWFGVPDGAFLTGPLPVHVPEPVPLAAPPAHLLERRWGDSDNAYRLYVQYEASLNAEVNAISTESIALLNGIDCAAVISARRRNFSYLHQRLGAANHLKVMPQDDAVPFCYPFLPRRELSRTSLAKRGFFIPQFWRDCEVRGSKDYNWERQLSERMLPLPIDHRYNAQDLCRLADALMQDLAESENDSIA